MRGWMAVALAALAGPAAAEVTVTDARLDFAAEPFLTVRVEVTNEGPERYSLLRVPCEVMLYGRPIAQTEAIFTDLEPGEVARSGALVTERPPELLRADGVRCVSP